MESPGGGGCSGVVRMEGSKKGEGVGEGKRRGVLDGVGGRGGSGSW